MSIVLFIFRRILLVPSSLLSCLAVRLRRSGPNESPARRVEMEPILMGSQTKKKYGSRALTQDEQAGLRAGIISSVVVQFTQR